MRPGDDIDATGGPTDRHRATSEIGSEGGSYADARLGQPAETAEPPGATAASGGLARGLSAEISGGSMRTSDLREAIGSGRGVTSTVRYPTEPPVAPTSVHSSRPKWSGRSFVVGLAGGAALWWAARTIGKGRR